MQDGLDVDLMLTGDLRYSVPPLFGYSKFTWRDGNGSNVMTYFCHAEKLSLGFSIYKYALSVFFCFFCLDQTMALPWVCDIVIWSSDLWAETQTVESSWALEMHHNRKGGQSGVVLLKEAFALKPLHNKEPPLFHHLLSWTIVLLNHNFSIHTVTVSVMWLFVSY